MVERYLQMVAQLERELPAGDRVAVIGSTRFWHDETEATCESVGANLARVERLVLLTGGVPGVPECTASAFAGSLGDEAALLRLVHVLPEGHLPCETGRTFFVGDSMEERREMLGRLARVYIVIEGGPGTAHEAAVAAERGALVIPVGRSGGFAGDLYPRMARPAGVEEEDWRLLGDTGAYVPQVSAAILRCARAGLRGD